MKYLRWQTSRLRGFWDLLQHQLHIVQLSSKYGHYANWDWWAAVMCSNKKWRRKRKGGEEKDNPQGHWTPHPHIPSPSYSLTLGLSPFSHSILYSFSNPSRNGGNKGFHFHWCVQAHVTWGGKNNVFLKHCWTGSELKAVEEHIWREKTEGSKDNKDTTDTGSESLLQYHIGCVLLLQNMSPTVDSTAVIANLKFTSSHHISKRRYLIFSVSTETPMCLTLQ